MKDKLTNRDIINLRNYIEKLEDFVLENGSELDLPNILEQHRVKETISYLMLKGLNTPEKVAHEADWVIDKEDLFDTEMITYTCSYCGKKVYEASAFCPSCGHLMLNYKKIVEEIKVFGIPILASDKRKDWDWYTEKGFDDALDEDYDEDYTEEIKSFAKEMVSRIDSKEQVNSDLHNDEINQLLSDGMEDELSRVGQAYGLNLRRVEEGVYSNKQKHWNKVDINAFAEDLPKGYTILGSNTDEEGMGYVVDVIAQCIENFNDKVTKYVNSMMSYNFGLTIAKSGKKSANEDFFQSGT